MEQLLKGALFALMVGLAMLLVVPVATADTVDQQFISTLAQGGWHTTCPSQQGCDAYVRIAHNTCDMLTYQRGWFPTPRKVAEDPGWYMAPPGSPKILFFVKAAITYYCPQYLSQVDW